MPSLFSRRKSNATELGATPSPESATHRAKRGSVDVAHLESDTTGSPEGKGKFKSVLRGSISETKTTLGGIFHKDAKAPADPNHVHRPSFSLPVPHGVTNGVPTASTAGDVTPRANGGGTGGHWIDAYSIATAASAPEDRLIAPENQEPVHPQDENGHRRSQDIPNGLSAWEPLKPDAPKPTSLASPISSPIESSAPKVALNSLPSPTMSPIHANDGPSRQREDSTDSAEQLMDRKPSTDSTKPLRMSMDSAGGRPSVDSAGFRPSLDSAGARPSTEASRPSLEANQRMSAFTAGNIPEGLIMGPTGKLRPNMPMRRTTLITSPPMPQPIKNLPTLQGWAGFNQASGGSATPAWGVPGVPRTPGWGEATPTPGAARTPMRTPGGLGFPFVGTPTQEKGKGTDLSDAEMRKARRAMPVMLREPSYRPAVREEGGDAEDDEEDEDEDDSGTEMEGDDDDDSEPETETENRTAAKGKGKARQPLLPLKVKLQGKGKGKAKAAPSSLKSPLAISTVTEEDDTPPLARARAPAASSSASIPAPAPAPVAAAASASTVAAATAAAGKGKAKVTTPGAGKGPWTLPASSQRAAGAWASFGAESPISSPVAPEVSELSPVRSVASSSGGMDEGGDYFGSQASSIHASTLGGSSTSTSGIVAAEPKLGTGTTEEIAATIPTPALATPLSAGIARPPASPGVTRLQPPMESPHSTGSVGSADAEGDAEDSDNDSVDGSEDPGSSIGRAGSMTTIASSTVGASPVTPITPKRPGVPQRPSLYSQASQSMVEIRRHSTEEQPDEEMPEVGAAKPTLQTIPSGQSIRPTRIEIPSRRPTFNNGLPTPGIPQTPGVPQTPGEWAKPPPTPAAGYGGGAFWAGGRRSLDDPRATLKRRRSADDISKPPPRYEPPPPGMYIPRPRDDEGKEKLPKYWCAVHIEGNISRKMEFASPGVQSRDRSWKKVYAILRGTQLTLFKFDPHKHPLKADNVLIPSVTEAESDEHLHVHIPGEKKHPVSTTPPRGSVDGGPETWNVGANTVIGQRRASAAAASPLSTSTTASGTTEGRRGSVGVGSSPAETRRSSVTSNMPSDTRRGSIPFAQNVITANAERRGSIGAVSGGDRSRSASVSSANPFGLPSGPVSDRSRSTSISAGSSGGSTAPTTTTATSGYSEKDPTMFPNTGRRASVASTASTSSTTQGGSKLASHFQSNQIVRTYTLQNAESGLAADYVKRKNVVRVRAEGEQFLLQTEGAREVVDWIEAFQAGTNVSLDLDDRPMPKIITLPRRRRRRPAGGAAGSNALGANPNTADTAEGNVAAVRAAELAERMRREEERERMLGEDQEAMHASND